MSVTSSLGRRPFGYPAGSLLNAAPSRLCISGAVGGTRRSSRNSSAHGLPQSVPFSGWPGYLSRRLIRSVRLLATEPSIGRIGTPNTRFSCCDHRILVEVLEIRLVLRLRGVPPVLEGRSDDQLVDQRVCHARHLHEWLLFVHRLT